MDIEKLKLDAEVRMANVEVQADRIKSEDRRAGANIGAKLATDIRKESSAEKQKGAEMGLKAAEAIIRDATKPQGGGQ
jgi:hypothetical protein